MAYTNRHRVIKVLTVSIRNIYYCPEHCKELKACDLCVIAGHAIGPVGIAIQIWGL